MSDDIKIPHDKEVDVLQYYNPVKSFQDKISELMEEIKYYKAEENAATLRFTREMEKQFPKLKGNNWEFNEEGMKFEIDEDDIQYPPGIPEELKKIFRMIKKSGGNIGGSFLL